MIETKRCILKEVEQLDYENIRQLYTNEKVRAYLGGIRTEEQIKEIVSNMLFPSNQEKYWIVTETRNNQFIGVVSLDTHHDGSSTEVSYQFLPQWWGVGLATEVIQEVCTYAFDVLRLESIVAETQMANVPSRNLLERIGFTLSEIVERFDAKQGIYEMKRK
ncbi:MAG: GNAT family N-acetyltransferase [Bacillaceae bacterium]